MCKFQLLVDEKCPDSKLVRPMERDLKENVDEVALEE